MSTAELQDHATKEKAEILAVIEGMKKARHDKNVRDLAAPYTADAAIFSLAPPLVHRGINIADMQAWLDTWEGPIEITPQDFEVHVSGDLAFCHGYMRMDGLKKGADQPISFWMRETLCLERHDEEWRIVHEHTSVPFYMDGSLRPAFDLQP
ncbi:MAG: nuclear transport factor 2 family protein [Acidobacteriaceae bacterium]